MFTVMLIIFSIISLASSLFAQAKQISVSESPNQTNLVNNTQFGFDVEFKVGDFKIEEIKTRGGTFDEISIEGYGHSSRIGEPKLPVLSKIIAVPVGATVSFDVINRNQKTLTKTKAQLLHNIVPAQLSISKSEDPANVPFEVNEAAYSRNAFTDNQMFTVEEIGFMRGVRVFQIYFEPVRYNPVSGELMFSNDVQIRVNFNNPDFIATEELLAKTASYEFDRVYYRTLFNWREGERPSLVRYPTKYLILCPPNYVTTLQPFVDWKKQQGYQVIVTTVGTGGTVTNSTTAINTYMAGVWSSSTTENPAPTYLLIVGDTSTSGDNIIANTGVSASHVTDLTYVRLNGTDYIPEMYYGRFSVSSATELTNIVNKSVTFEKTLMPDLSYLGNVVMIAGVDATYAPTYGNGQINYGTTHYFNATNGITSNTYLYPASGSSDAAVIANANAGRGYINYTAHGSETSWADPTFTVSNVNAMTNTNKYGVMVGNCCVTNAFGTSVCFGESIIRKANAAGVAYIGATNNSYWDEDYWWGIGYKTPIQAAAHPYSASTLGAYDAMFHTHGEAFTDWATTVGETNFMGNSAVQQSTSPRKPYYWEIYSIMGDPSLMPYYGVPSVNTATYPSTILVGATSINVTAAPYSRVALTMGGVLYGTALVPAGGSLTLPITAFTIPGTAKLVITAQNKITIMADVTIAPNSGPYVNVTAANYADSNNSSPEYNETGRFNVTYQNVGSSTATGLTATLTCSTPGIIITDNVEVIASLASGASTTINNAYTFNISNNIANGTSAAFTITMVSGANTWIHNFSLVINAPALTFGSITIQDPTGNNNGRLDPGETVTVIMPLNNTGGAASLSGNATLSCSSPPTGITINTPTANFPAIASTGSTNLSFSVTASSGLSIGTVVSLVFNATAGAYTANKNEATTVGIIIEDFESGNFNSFPWTLAGIANWTAVNTGAYAGTYCAKSGTIVANQTTTMQTVRILTTGGNLSFWYKVSSESGYDYLRFYVDGTQVTSWSGEVAWTQYTYALAAGTRTLKWEYMKDGSVNSGSDCAWVDDIIFPASTIYTPATITWTAALDSQELAPDQTGSQILTIGNTGNETLNYTVSKPMGTTTVLDESFENSGSIPTGWTQSYVTGTTTWIYTAGGHSSHPAAAQDGSYNAQLYYGSSTAIITKLITPVMNLSGATSASLTFYHTQEVWVSDQDELKVYYGTSASGPWTQLAYYTSSIAAWTLETISLPGLSGTYYIAFEGIAKYGYGVCLDKVVVTKYSAVSVPWLSVNGGDSYSSSIIGGGADQDVTIGFNSAGLGVGTYNSNLTLTSNSTTNPSINIPVELIVSSTSIPVILVSPMTLDYGNVPIDNTAIEQFTIQNTGTGTLTGNITTPTRYSVAEASRQADVKIAQSSNGLRNVLGYSVNSGQSKTYNLTFAPTAVTGYNGNVVITSNDTGNPTVNIAVTGSGFIPLTLTLPDSFNFDKNGNLAVDFSPYITDSSGNPLILTPGGNTNVNVGVNNLMVTFTAVQNWIGTETITFTLDNSITQVLDTVEITVNPTDMPSWIPVTYPNNSATVYGIVTVDLIDCQLNDVVGAFVGTECRAMAEVTMDNGNAYVALLVNLASEGETVSFKVYDYSADTIYPVMETHALNFGQVLGESTPVPINGVSTIVLDAPIVTITHTTEGTVLDWAAVNLADEYHIYRSELPYTGFTQVGNTTALEYLDTTVLDKAFYYVKAVKNMAAQRTIRN